MINLGKVMCVSLMIITVDIRLSLLSSTLCNVVYSIDKFMAHFTQIHSSSYIMYWFWKFPDSCFGWNIYSVFVLPLWVIFIYSLGSYQFFYWLLIILLHISPLTYNLKKITVHPFNHINHLFTKTIIHLYATISPKSKC